MHFHKFLHISQEYKKGYHDQLYQKLPINQVKLYVHVGCFVVRGCAVSRRYIHVCNCDMFSVVYVYPDHLKFCVVCIDGRRYVCCSECNVVSNECTDPTSCLVQPIDLNK